MLSSASPFVVPHSVIDKFILPFCAPGRSSLIIPLNYRYGSCTIIVRGISCSCLIDTGADFSGHSEALTNRLPTVYSPLPFRGVSTSDVVVSPSISHVDISFSGFDFFFPGQSSVTRRSAV